MFLLRALITWPPLQDSSSRGIFPSIPILIHLLSLSFLYLFLPHPYSSLAINSLGNSRQNSFSSSSSSCHLSSSASSLYSLSNSSTSFFVFPRFSLFSYISFSTVYPFHHTKNLTFPHTVLLFKIFSTLNSSSPSMMTSFGGVFFCPSACGL